MRDFGSYHPLVLMAYFAAVIAVAMFSVHPVMLALAVAGGIMYYCSVTDRGIIFRNLLVYMVFFVMITVTNPFFSHKGATILFFIDSNPVTLEAFYYGMSIGAMVVGVMLWFGNYSAVMTTDKFLYLFGRVMPRLTLIFSMVLRFIPLFRNHLKKVSDSRRALGGYAEKGPAARIRSAAGVFSIMITWSLEMAVSVADSMKARGYATYKRSNFSLYRFAGRDLRMLILTGLLTAAVLAGMASGRLDFAYYPYMTEIRPDPGVLPFYAAYACLVFLPSAIQIKENIEWKYLISKI